MIRLTIYSRPGCHLCDEMKHLVAHVVARRPHVAVDEIDISTDASLERKYGEEIPVLFIDGRKAAKYRISEQELRRRLGG